MLIEFDDAYRAMSPYFDRLWGVVNGAWADWNEEISPKVRALAHSRTRACMVNDFMRTRGSRLSLEDSSVSVILKRQMFVLVFSPPGFAGSIGVRLKKLDEEGLSRNQPTTQVSAFREQLMLPDFNADYHLEAGYVTDRFGSALSSIDLVCPAGDAIHWKAEIVPGGSNVTLPNLFPEKAESIKTVQVRRKIDKDVGENDGASGAS